MYCFTGIVLEKLFDSTKNTRDYSFAVIIDGIEDNKCEMDIDSVEKHKEMKFCGLDKSDKCDPAKPPVWNVINNPIISCLVPHCKECMATDENTCITCD